jgi:hypothetical protein
VHGLSYAGASISARTVVLFRTRQLSTERIRARKARLNALRVRWNVSFCLIRCGAERSSLINRRCYVVVRTGALHQGIDTTGTGNGDEVDLLAAGASEFACCFLICHILGGTPIQAVTYSIASGLEGGNAGIPGENHPVVSINLCR